MSIKFLNTGFTSSDGMSAHNHTRTGAWEFHYFIEGSGIFLNNDRESVVCPGQIFLSAPGDNHLATKNPGPGRLLFYWLQYEPNDDPLHDELYSSFKSSSFLQIGKSHIPEFEDLRRRWSTTIPLMRRSAHARLELLFCDICQTQGDSETSPAAVRYVEEAIALMFASIHEPLNLDQIAQKLGIDKAYFSRIFHDRMAQPPMRYFLGLRLDAAKHHLLTGNIPLRTLAKDYGFHDEFHFSHQFKAFTGVSPQTWRSQSRKIKKSAS